jgi:hypothetical protein
VRGFVPVSLTSSAEINVAPIPQRGIHLSRIISMARLLLSR